MKKEKCLINELIKIENSMNLKKTISEEDELFKKLMFIYSIAMKQLMTKMEILKEKSKIFYDYELIDNIKTRIKTPQSIINKMKKKGYNFTYEEMIYNINDIAGIRIICPLKRDIFVIKDLIKKLSGVNIIKEKDYVTNPKKSGYSSYHLIVETPTNLFEKTIYVKVEIQIRTLTMDFWANLEHKTKYKPEQKIDEKYIKLLSLNNN